MASFYFEHPRKGLNGPGPLLLASAYTSTHAESHGIAALERTIETLGAAAPLLPQ
jgi:hypothetical protein